MHIAPPDGSITLAKVQLGLCVNVMLDCHINACGLVYLIMSDDKLQDVK